MFASSILYYKYLLKSYLASIVLSVRGGRKNVRCINKKKCHRYYIFCKKNVYKIINKKEIAYCINIFLFTPENNSAFIQNISFEKYIKIFWKTDKANFALILERKQFTINLYSLLFAYVGFFRFGMYYWERGWFCILLISN